MANIAILIGNSKYASQSDLACCEADVEAMASLLTATEKFDKVRQVKNANSDEIRNRLRQELEEATSLDEFFFYFSGHGIQIKSEFFYCGTEFDVDRPNETGLANTELHTILRAYSPKLVVKVVDACNSGTTLIKGDLPIISDGKGVLSDVIQIAACQNSQFSLTGNPLSIFTKHFCQAAFRKESGSVYYTDIINTIRDDFLNDDEQTPHFVSQGTGREKFVADVVNLATYRKEFATRWEHAPVAGTAVVAANNASQTMLQLIGEAEDEFVTPEDAENYISTLFDGIIEKLNTDDFSDFYTVGIVEHDDYKEDTARSFIIRSLSNQSRPDNFVTARITRKRKNRNVFEAYATGLASTLGALYGNDEFSESWTLDLNCSLRRAQIKLTLNPKFKSLNQIRLVVSCAPSLNHCYVFEISTRHLRIDWDSFDEDGETINKNWYELPWGNDHDWLIEAICSRIHQATMAHLENTAKRLEAAKKDDEDEGEDK